MNARRITQAWLGAFAILLLGWSVPAFGQGVLIIVDPVHPTPLPRPIIRTRPQPVEQSYKIKELTINGRINDQVARVQVTQSFVNTGSRQMEVSFCFPLPYDGAIDQMTFMVDGKEYEAKLLAAKEARSIYEGYIRRNQDPALLEWMGTGMFKTSVFPVPPGAERKVTIRFSQLLRKDSRLTDFLYPLSTAKYTSQPIETVTINASIESTAKLKSVYSPTHDVEVNRSDDHHATVKFEAKNHVPTSDFRLFYDTSKEKVGASVISFRPDNSEDGFFLMLASPEIPMKTDDQPAKTAVFVVDRSGSMSGKKIEQAKDALKFVLNNLRDGDLFNIIAYDSSVESFRPELQKFNDETRKAALGFVESIYAGGSTNISGALTQALDMIQDPDRPNYVVFLTDGLPTAGETNEMKIAQMTKQHNKHHARVVSFGVGYDVNSRLLDRISHDNYGQSEFVRPDEDIEAHVSRLYSRISSPVMTDVAVDIDVEGAKVEEGKAINRIYPREVHDLFAGEQLVMVGRYRKPGEAKVTITGKVGDNNKKMDFPAKLAESSSDDTYAFVEKLWAMRRIGEIIDELDLKGQNQELVDELVALSTRHGILTPYTSFLADETSTVNELADARGNAVRARRMLDQLSVAEGRSGFAQRAEKKSLREANQVTQNFNLELAESAADSSAATPAPAATASRPSRSAGRGGFGGGVPTGPAGGLPGAMPANQPAAPNGVAYRDIENDRVVVAESVQVVGNETLYKRGNLWVAENAKDVDPEKDKAKIKTIKRFSDDYFKLIAANTASENSVLARQQAGETLLIKLRGQAYRIE
ncbi:MAG: VWA domain-containing protein [Planctomycetales bacterium]|nr:VWA domain-containing protein [Planctomycetales bacterium]MCA9226043.1 VWA domain-containing protein [Planctomycetales bacterium]